MGQHRALGRAGGAGGVDHQRRVVGRGFFEHRVDARIRVGVGGEPGVARLQQRLEGGQLRVGVETHALHVDADDMGHLGQPLALRPCVEDLVGLLLVAADREAGAAVAGDVLQLRPGVGGVDADRDGADHLGAEVGVIPLRRVLRGDDDPVAPPDAEAEQGPREAPRLPLVMRPVVAAPDAEVLLPQRQLRRRAAGALAQQAREGGVPGAQGLEGQRVVAGGERGAVGGEEFDRRVGQAGGRVQGHQPALAWRRGAGSARAAAASAPR